MDLICPLSLLCTSQSPFRTRQNRSISGTAVNYSTTMKTPEKSNHATSNHATPKPKRRNWGLESVKEQGLSLLENTASEIQSKTKQRLLYKDEDNGPTVLQIREAHRLKILVEDAIEQYTSKKGNTFCIKSEPIAIMDAEISADLKQARVYWSLPYGVLSMESLSLESQGIIIKKMQSILDKRGGVLKGMVHAQLRMYRRAPNIRFVPADGALLNRALKDLF